LHEGDAPILQTTIWRLVDDGVQARSVLDGCVSQVSRYWFRWQNNRRVVRTL
jgi:hypothetical protein